MNPPSVTFAPAGTDTIKKEFALSDAERAALTRENLRTLTQDQVDQIYKRLKAGRIPDGPFRGDLFFPRDQSGTAHLADVPEPAPAVLAHVASLRLRSAQGEIDKVSKDRDELRDALNNTTAIAANLQKDK